MISRSILPVPHTIINIFVKIITYLLYFSVLQNATCHCRQIILTSFRPHHVSCSSSFSHTLNPDSHTAFSHPKLHWRDPLDLLKYPAEVIAVRITDKRRDLRDRQIIKMKQGLGQHNAVFLDVLYYRISSFLL